MKLLENRFIDVRQLVQVEGTLYLWNIQKMGIVTDNTVNRIIAEAQVSKRLLTVFTDKSVNLLVGDRFRREDDGTWIRILSRGADTGTSPVNSNLSYYSAQAESYTPTHEEQDAPIWAPPDEPQPPIEPPDERPEPQSVRLLYAKYVKDPLGGYEYKYFLSGIFPAVVFENGMFTTQIITRPDDNTIATSSRIRIEAANGQPEAWRLVTNDPAFADDEYFFNTEPYEPTYDEKRATILNP